MNLDSEQPQNNMEDDDTMLNRHPSVLSEAELVTKLPKEDTLHNMIIKPENEDANDDIFLDENGNPVRVRKGNKDASMIRSQQQADALDAEAKALGLLDENIKMLCETHKAPAVFFSNKEKRYVCFKCLVSMEKLQYIDKSYNAEMEEFERIKELTNDACRSNLKNLDIIKKWKYEVRNSLMKVKERFIKNMDTFIYDFCNLFLDVD